jgi:hypothetical protein
MARIVTPLARDDTLQLNSQKDDFRKINMFFGMNGLIAFDGLRQSDEA